MSPSLKIYPVSPKPHFDGSKFLGFILYSFAKYNFNYFTSSSHPIVILENHNQEQCVKTNGNNDEILVI